MARSTNVPRGPKGGNSADPAALAQAGDLLVANVGNTNVRLVRFAGGVKVADERVPTAEAAGSLTQVDRVPIALVSVVPATADALATAWRAAGADVFQLMHATVGLAVDYEPASALGADRLANALALWHLHGPGIAVDCGTATTLTLVDAEGVVRGGAILPGLATARDSLWQATAQLPAVPLEPAARAVGRSTLESLQVGLVDGHVGAVAHLALRMRQAFPAATQLVVTGGWGGLLAPLLLEYADARHEPDLTISGARLAWARREPEERGGP